MTPSENVYYFGDNIDVRLCLKNGYTTLRHAWVSHTNILEFNRCIENGIIKEGKEVNHCGWGSQELRNKLIYKNGDIWDLPFRKNSYRIAIKRDPVQRFISAVSHLSRVKLQKNLSNHKSYIDLSAVTDEDINSVINGIKNEVIKDEHFYSQHWFMGDPNQYDKIYDISEMHDLLRFLEDNCETKVSITNLWENRTKKTQKRIELTKEQEIAVIKLYAKDYAYNWC